MITTSKLARLVDYCMKQKVRENIGNEACAGCPLSNLCDEIVKLNKVHKEKYGEDN